jgi:hypothetical protein
MEVVEKITSISREEDNYMYNYVCIGYDFEDKTHYSELWVSDDDILQRKSKTSKIEALYSSCIEFVKWYNKNNKS